MGLFSSIFHANKETNEQKRQRVLSQAIVSDKEIRFAKNYNRILTSFKNDQHSGVQRHDPDALLYLLVLTEMHKEALGKYLSPTESDLCIRIKNNFLKLMPEIAFCQQVRECKESIISQISDVLRCDLKDPDSAEILNAKPNGSYVQVYRQGIIKTIQLYEQAGLHEVACGMRKMIG